MSLDFLITSLFLLLTFVVFAVYGVFAAAVRDQVVSRPLVLTWLRRTFVAALSRRLARSWRWPTDRSLGER